VHVLLHQWCLKQHTPPRKPHRKPSQITAAVQQPPHPAEATAVDHPAADMAALPAAEVLATCSASHSATQVDMDMDTDGTSRCHGGSGIPAASAITRDTDSESTVSEEAVAVDMEVAAVVMAEMEEEDMVEAETADMEVVAVDIKSLAKQLKISSPQPIYRTSTNKPDNCSHSKFLLPFSIRAGSWM